MCNGERGWKAALFGANKKLFRAITCGGCWLRGGVMASALSAKMKNRKSEIDKLKNRKIERRPTRKRKGKIGSPINRFLQCDIPCSDRLASRSLLLRIKERSPR